jgi:hypothetical protein
MRSSSLALIRDRAIELDKVIMGGADPGSAARENSHAGIA